MRKYIPIIKEVAEEATNAYCLSTACANCEYVHFSNNCSNKCRTVFTERLVTALAIEKVKEKANESKD